MRSNTLSSAICAILASSAQALPNLAERATCNRDLCLRGLIIESLSSVGYADCSSFLHKTVTPCPVTSTVEALETVTVQTVTDTVEEYTTTVLWETEYTTTVATETAGAFSFKRGLPVEARETGIAQPNPAVNFPREVITDCPATATPTSVPKYASACSGTVRYSSACSCLGVSASVTTLDPVTTTVTTTQTDEVTSYTTFTNTNVVTEVSTTTSTIVETTTVPLPCATFLARKVGGGPVHNGRWIKGGPAAGHTLEAKGASEMSKASKFILNADGTIKFPENGNLWTIANAAPTTRRTIRLWPGTTGGQSKLTCTFANAPAAKGEMICQTATQSLVWVACPAVPGVPGTPGLQNTNDHLWAAPADNVPGNCEVISLVAQEACAV